MAESELHKYLVDLTVKKMEQDGYTIQGVDNRSPQYEKPLPVNEHIPDIYATKDGVFVVVEAEPCEAIGELVTKIQWAAFRKWADGAANREFWLSVPERCQEDGKDISGAELAQKEGMKFEHIIMIR